MYILNSSNFDPAFSFINLEFLLFLISVAFGCNFEPDFPKADNTLLAIFA